MNMLQIFPIICKTFALQSSVYTLESYKFKWVDVISNAINGYRDVDNFIHSQI